MGGNRRFRGHDTIHPVCTRHYTAGFQRPRRTHTLPVDRKSSRTVLSRYVHRRQITGAHVARALFRVNVYSPERTRYHDNDDRHNNNDVVTDIQSRKERTVVCVCVCVRTRVKYKRRARACVCVFFI